MRKNRDLYCGCISGAVEAGAIETMLATAGFDSIRFRVKNPEMPVVEMSEENAHQFVSSAVIEAMKSDSSQN